MATSVSTLENLKEEIIPKVPSFTSDQLARILLQQRHELTIQTTIHQLQKQLDQCPQEMDILLSNLLDELNVKKDTVVVDLNTLKMSLKTK